MIDHDRDEFIDITGFPISEWNYSTPCIDDLIENYLRSTEMLEYDFPPLHNYKGHGIHPERQRLCQMLVQKVNTVRKLSNEEADWDLDIVSGNRQWLQWLGL